MSSERDSRTVPTSLQRLRPLLVLAFFLGLFVLARLLGWDRLVDAEALRPLITEAGWLGPLAYVGLFIVGLTAQLPGVLFVPLAAPFFDPWTGWFTVLLAGNVGTVFNFWLLRRLGGQPLTETGRPWLQKVLAQLDSHPLRSVILIRLVLIMLPLATAALAFSRVSFRQHALGNFLGLLIPVSVMYWLAWLALS